MRFLLTISLLLSLMVMGTAQTARLQVIHNSPSPTVDIYVNDDLFLDNFAYRTATPFTDVPAGVQLNLGVALANSSSVDDALVTFPVTLEENQTYVVVATGIVGGTPGFELAVFDMGQETVASDDEVGLLFFHGSPDAPEVDILVDGNVAYDDVAYSNFSGYATVPAAPTYTIDVTPSGDNDTVVARYEGDFDFWGGRTAVIFASGFFDGSDPAFEPWVALDNGGTFPLMALPLPDDEDDDIAKVQIVHNSPDPAATMVDIYLNNDLLLDDFEFRTATPFVEVPVATTLTINVAPANSASSADAIASFDVVFEAGKRYIAVANGLIAGTPSFFIDIFDMGRETASESDQFDLAFHHGSPDAPVVDIAARTIGTIVPELAYSDFADYLSLDIGTYYVDVAASNASTLLATYEADLTGLEGRAGIAIATGLLSGQEPAFGVMVVLDNGDVVNLPLAAIARLQVIHNSPSPTVDIYVNDDLFLDDFAFRTASPFVFVPAGVTLDVGVALSNSTSADDAIANFPVSLQNGRTYVAVANGIVGGNPGFELAVTDMGMERVEDDGDVGLLFFHGSPDAPQVDILADGAVLFDNQSYGDFSEGYAVVPAGSYNIDVTPANDNNTIVASYTADLGFWSGRTAVVFASGFLGGGDPAFEPWVALDNGGTFPLPPAGPSPLSAPIPASSNVLTDSWYEVFPNPVSDLLTVDFEQDEAGSVQVNVWNTAGQAVYNDVINSLDEGRQRLSIPAHTLDAGVYFLEVRTATGTFREPVQVIKQ